MDNYHYIIASLPVLSEDMKDSGGLDPEELTSWIRSQCSDRDNALIDILEEGFRGESLTEEFYSRAAASKNGFIREYFSYDLTMRNVKVRWLNKALGRPAEQDTVPEPEPDPMTVEEIDKALDTPGILERERAMDDLLWAKIGELTTFSWFDIDAVLGFLAKLHIIWRWLALDPVTGREMFRKLVDEVRGTFKGVNCQTENQTESIS